MDGLKVADLMAKDVVSVDKDERLETVLDLMRKHRISKMPVVEKGKIVGVVTDGEIADELGAMKNRGIATSALHVSSAMRRHFATIGPETDVAEALRLFREDDAGILPVCHDGIPVGVLTLADLLPLVTSTTRLRDVMRTELYAVEPTDRVIHARRMMLDHNVERLPVLTGGRLVGVVGESDVAFGLAALRKRTPDRHLADQLKRFYVEEIMTANVVTGDPDATAREAAATMREAHVGCLPLVNAERKILGMVTRHDLLALAPAATAKPAAPARR